MKRYGIRNWAGVGPPERVEREFRKGGRRYFDDRPRPSRQREQSDFMRRSVETLRGEARAGSESRPRRERGSRNATPLPNCLRNSSTVSVGDVSRGYQGGERYGSPPCAYPMRVCFKLGVGRGIRGVCAVPFFAPTGAALRVPPGIEASGCGGIREAVPATPRAVSAGRRRVLSARVGSCADLRGLKGGSEREGLARAGRSVAAEHFGLLVGGRRVELRPAPEEACAHVEGEEDRDGLGRLFQCAEECFHAERVPCARGCVKPWVLCCRAAVVRISLG